MKTVIEYLYSYFKVFHMWGSAGAAWHWDMDHDQLADAALYKGRMRIKYAYDRALEGYVFQGFCEFRRASPHLSRYLQYQFCVTDVDTEWYCVHGVDCSLDISFVQMTGELMVPENTSFLVLEGEAHVRCNGTLIDLSAMQHFQPREFSFRVSGAAKALLLKRSGPLPSVELPLGIGSVDDAVAALRALQ